MKLEEEIKELQKELEGIDDPQLILIIRNLLSYSKTKPGERITVEQYNKEIDEAVARYESGNYITHEKAKDLMNRW